MRREYRRKPLHPVRSGIAAHPHIHHAISVAGGVDQALQIVGIALAGIEPQPGRETIAERGDHGTRIIYLRRHFLRRRLHSSLRGVWTGGLFLVSACRIATASAAASIHLSNTAIIMTDAHQESRIPHPIIEVVSLTRTIETPTHRVEILRGIDLAIPAASSPPSWGLPVVGKVRLLGLLAGLDNASSGQVLLDGVDITGLSEDRMAEVRGRKIGFVFQSFQLIPTLTAEENVMLPAELAGAGRNVTRRAKELLTRVGLADRLDHYPVQLSGGEQQRVALARAFITKPPILLADEPTGNLDGKTGQQVLELLLELNRLKAPPWYW